MAGLSKILVTGHSDCERVLREERLSGYFEWQKTQTENFGCQIDVTIDLLKKCDSVILVISHKTFTECNNGLKDIVAILLAVKNLKEKPHSVVVVGSDIEELPLAFQRLRHPVLINSIDEIVEVFGDVLKQLEGSNIHIK